MGLKEDIIQAQIDSEVAQGISEEDIDSSDGSGIEVFAEKVTEAIGNFLQNLEFSITKLNGKVVLTDFKIPDQPVNVKMDTLLGEYGPLLDTLRQLPVPGISELVNQVQEQIELAIEPLLEGGSTLPGPEVDSDNGLIANGYVYIGEDPEHQENFDIDDEEGQRNFTTVIIHPEDMEDKLRDN